MSIDINAIAQEKITSMEESGEIRSHIEESLKKLVMNSVASAFEGYEIRRKIQEKIESQVSPCLDALDFTAYNSFICEKFRQITEEYLKKDIARKISETFDSIFMLKRESIKLSEIFAAYRQWLIDDLEENEQYELNNEFYASVEEDGKYGRWLECGLSKEAPEKPFISPRKDIYTCNFGFVVGNATSEKKIGKIISVYFEGSSVKEVLKINSYNSFQSLLLNLYYNETPVILDVESEDDIDTSLDLDI